MKRIVILAWLFTSLFFFVSGAAAQAPGDSDKKVPAPTARSADEILTAIDVAALWNKGLSDADVAALLSNQWGYDRQAALKKGETDEQIIKRLITSTGKTPPQTDAVKSDQFKSAGDQYFRESNYGKAASEYTMAIETSMKSHELYIIRASTYKQYLKTKVNPEIKSDSDKTKQGQPDKSRDLLCHAIYADYEKAAQLSKEKKAESYAEMKAIQAKLNEKAMDDRAGNVAPYHRRASQHIQSTRQLKKQYYDARKSANQPAFTMEQAMPDYKKVCETKDGATR